MRIYKIKVNGKTYEVKGRGITEGEPTEGPTVKGTVPAPAPKPAQEAPKVASTGGASIDAPMQGTILDVKVKVGDVIKAGDTVAILEAMKLENEIKAPSDGKVKEIAVSKGQSVNAKQPILFLE